MSELIKLTKKNENTISSVELVKIINEYRRLEGNKSELVHSNFLKKIENELNGDEVNFYSTYLDASNRQSRCYDLPKDEATLMLMSESRTVRKGVLLKLRALERPRTHLEVLQSEMALLVEKEKVQMELMEANSTIQALEPKRIFADAVSASKNTILVGELAKILKQNGIDMGQNRFFEWLRSHSYLISRNGTDYNMPTQKSMELGLFEIKETVIAHSDGHTSISKTAKVSGKGQAYFINKFLNQAAA